MNDLPPEQISPFSLLISGGKATVAQMFANMATGQRGLVCHYDAVYFDEVSGKHVNKLLENFGLRERLILQFAVVAGMRCGEIFALKRGDVTGASASISRRVYRGDIDTPKTRKSVRLVALPRGLGRDLHGWLKASPDTGPEGWLFPSEKLTTPIRPDGIWKRLIRPKLIQKGFAGVNSQVLRRTAASAMRNAGVDPKVVADQLGHTVDVSTNVYTQTSMKRLSEAVTIAETAFSKKKNKNNK